ncbi:hypothetical protein EK904_011284 [Melospiza melodia maxima]|nr:hypothetical protein EK904_011284 [Melospiza melodia maxima]
MQFPAFGNTASEGLPGLEDEDEPFPKLPCWVLTRQEFVLFPHRAADLEAILRDCTTAQSNPTGAVAGAGSPLPLSAVPFFQV